MRVLQVVAYVGIGGEYGGPTAVAFEQTECLRELGCEVTMAAGWDGKATVDSDCELRLFRATRFGRRSFALLFSPMFLFWLVKNIRRFDVVHVHLARDLLTLPAAAIAARAGRPLIAQTHGMVRPDKRLVARLIDRFVVLSTLRRSRRILYLTSREREDLLSIGIIPDLLQQLDNGVSSSTEYARPAYTSPLVVFASRLAARKRPRAFVEAAALARSVRQDLKFEIWGADEGELAGVEADIARLEIGDSCRYMGAVDRAGVRSLFGRASVFVLPSLDEPFPMVLLESFAAGLPSVITDQTGLSVLAGTAGASIVVGESVEELAHAILRLVEEPQLWTDASLRARHLAAERFAITTVAKTLVKLYEAECHTDSV
ncbi:glycosyltransferase [Geodermatophilus sp. SYSU D01106]